MNREECVKRLKQAMFTLQPYNYVNEALQYAIDELTTHMDKKELIIHVMHGYDSLESPDGEKCFGCYVSGQYEIWVADDIPADQFWHTVMHEYKHYLQDISGKDFDEDEANDYATKVLSDLCQEVQEEEDKLNGISSNV